MENDNGYSTVLALMDKTSILNLLRSVQSRSRLWSNKKYITPFIFDVTADLANDRCDHSDASAALGRWRNSSETLAILKQ